MKEPIGILNKNMLNIKESFDKFYALIAIYMAAFIFAPVLSGGRDINFFGFPLMPGSLLTIVHMSLLAVLQQNYGKDTAKNLVLSSLVAKAFIWSFTLTTLLLPTLHADAGYEKMVTSSFRVFIAATIGRFVNAYLIEIPLFEYLRNKYNKFWVSFIITLLIETIMNCFVTSTDRPLNIPP